MPRAIIIGVGAAVLVLVLSGAGVLLFVAAKDDGRIADGVRVGSVDVGGMQRDEAGKLIRRRLAGTTGKPVAVLFNDTHYVMRADVAKARIDVDATLDAALDAGDDKTVAPQATYA